MTCFRQEPCPSLCLRLVMPLRLSQPGQLRGARCRACGSSSMSSPAWRLLLLQPVQLVSRGGGLRQVPLQLLLCGILRRWQVQGRSQLLVPRQTCLLQAG